MGMIRTLRKIKQDRDYYLRNRRRILKIARQYREKNWKRIIAYRNRPEVKKRQVEIVRERRKLTKDHIIPLDWCGSDFIDNIQPLCRSCNSKKHKSIIKYL